MLWFMNEVVYTFLFWLKANIFITAGQRPAEKT
jgi:hypothetical protein